MSGKSIPSIGEASAPNKFMAIYLGKNRDGKKCYGIIALPSSEDSPARLLTKGSDLQMALFDARGANQIHVESIKALPGDEVDDSFVMPEFLEPMLGNDARLAA
jgi:hypothetical protein